MELVKTDLVHPFLGHSRTNRGYGDTAGTLCLASLSTHHLFHGTRLGSPRKHGDEIRHQARIILSTGDLL